MNTIKSFVSLEIMGRRYIPNNYTLVFDQKHQFWLMLAINRNRNARKHLFFHKELLSDRVIFYCIKMSPRACTWSYKDHETPEQDVRWRQFAMRLHLFLWHSVPRSLIHNSTLIDCIPIIKVKVLCQLSEFYSSVSFTACWKLEDGWGFILIIRLLINRVLSPT